MAVFTHVSSTSTILNSTSLVLTPPGSISPINYLARSWSCLYRMFSELYSSFMAASKMAAIGTTNRLLGPMRSATGSRQNLRIEELEE